MILEIPEPTPSLNTHKWKHWSHHAKLRKHWSTLVMVAKGDAGIHGIPQLTRVKVTRCGRRLLDVDNYLGGLKALLDGLKDNGLIRDDDPQNMILSAHQKLVKKPELPRTIIEIT